MTVQEFVEKYKINQKGDSLSQTAFNIVELGKMLREHSLDEIPDIVSEMCSIREPQD